MQVWHIENTIVGISKIFVNSVHTDSTMTNARLVLNVALELISQKVQLLFEIINKQKKNIFALP